MSERPPVHRAIILVVEDFTPMRTLIERVLSSEGHLVVSVANFLAAQYQCAQIRFDLVLTDVHIPGGDGIQVARAAAARRPGLQVLIVSGDQQRDLDLTVPGATTAFLRKPFDIYDLVQQVARMLGPTEAFRRADPSA